MPVWLSWVLLIVSLLTLIAAWTIMGQLTSLRTLMENPGGVPRNRRELEDLYTKGAITRDAYERHKGRVK